MTKPRRTQAERRQEAETKLIAMATRFIAERGYDGFTLAEVGEAAGFSRGLPAHYFGKREELLRRVVEHIVVSFRDGLENIIDVDPGMPWLEALVRFYVSQTGTTAKAYAVLSSQAMVNAELRQTVSELTTQSHETIRIHIGRGQKAGNIRSDVDANREAYVIYSFLRGQMSFHVLDEQFDTKAIGETFIETIKARLAP